jgi:hypothetical protein
MLLARRWGAQVKLFNLAGEAIRLLKERGSEGIRSDELAEILGTPKRRIYDVIAILKALDGVNTVRRYNGTTIYWIDRFKDYVSRESYDDIKKQLESEQEIRKNLQVEAAELKESVRMLKSKLSRDVGAVEAVERTEFNTRQIKVRPLSRNGFKSVKDSGMEVVIETDEPGMIVDPTEEEHDETEDLLKNIQRI